MEQDAQVAASREVGAEMSTRNWAMGEICNTLAGGLPTNLPPYPPPVGPAQEPSKSPDPNAPGLDQPHRFSSHVMVFQLGHIDGAPASTPRYPE
ncbi:hypothetical protein NMY22_g8882 [Coprinellus aureogranulatus]|nr:hypothetical protein NMY22_g8882 [Coprinellus aureogranulatus]